MRPGIVRLEHSVFTVADRLLAWNIFADWKNWHRISNRYQSIQWYGAPWHHGSRLHVEILRPLRAKVDRVIMGCIPAQCVTWINHVLGYTMEQWVQFDAISGGGTKIFTWVEFTGPSALVQGRAVREVMREYLEDWYGCFRDQCDEAVGR